MNVNIKNNKDLQEDLSKVYESLRNEKMSLNQAKEAANVAGKIIGSVRVQLDYNKWIKNNAKIDFLEV